MDPQQELYTALLTGLKGLGYSVYDGALPPASTPYPFIYLGEAHQVDRANKTAVFGSVFQTVDVWHVATKRGTLSAMLGAVKSFCRSLSYTPSFSWDMKNPDQRIVTDDTSGTSLLHGILNIEMEFSRR